MTAVDAGSAAAQAGIQQNDVLLRLGGKDPKGLALGKPKDLEVGSEGRRRRARILDPASPR